MEPPDALRAFRRSFYECFHRRRDALFELADAILSADGVAPSPAHLSLQVPHRRGWGSLYAALRRGRIDYEALRKLLARHPLAGAQGEPSVYAVDVSVWDRCDAECSPLLKATTTILLATPLGSPSWSALGLPVHSTAQFRARELDRAHGPRAPPTRPRRQCGRLRAGEVVPTTQVLRGKDRR